MTITFDTETIRLITLFENLTGAPVRDCIVDNSNNYVYFIVEEGKMGVAIGRNGSSVRSAEKIMGKNIKVFEFSKDLRTFVKKLIPKALEVRIKNQEGKVLVEVKVEKRDKPLVIGRNGRNLKLLKELLHRNHGVDELIIW